MKFTNRDARLQGHTNFMMFSGFTIAKKSVPFMHPFVYSKNIGFIRFLIARLEDCSLDKKFNGFLVINYLFFNYHRSSIRSKSPGEFIFISCNCLEIRTIIRKYYISL